MAGTTPKKTLYPFAEMFEVDTDGTDSVDVWDISRGTIITMVLAKIKTPGTGSGNIIVGDDDDDNGFILAADGTAAADTVYGDAVAERGAYFTNAGGGLESHAGKWKVYTSAGKEIKMDCSNALTTEATIDIFVFGFRYHED